MVNLLRLALEWPCPLKTSINPISRLFVVVPRGPGWFDTGARATGVIDHIVIIGGVWRTFRLA